MQTAHIFFAVSSLVNIVITTINPSMTKLKVSEALFVCTMITGAYMLLVGSASLGRVCVSGSIYSIFAITGILFARKRLNGFSTNPK